MLDLGAFINSMPTSVYTSLGLGPFKQTNVIQLANKSWRINWIVQVNSHKPETTTLIPSTRMLLLHEHPPELELKPLLGHLKYAFLEANEKLPIIIAQSLQPKQEEKLLAILRAHKQAIG